MNEKINSYVDELFSPYNGEKSVAELKAELILDLHERFNELKVEGKDDDTAFSITVDSIGNIEETLSEMASLTHTLEREVLVNFNAQELKGSDFAGVTLHGGSFKSSSIIGADFTGADLSRCSFKCSDLRKACFDRANLSECNFSILDLREASFNQTILVKTEFNKSMLTGSRFIKVKFDNVNFTMADFRNTTFEDCIIDGGDFKYANFQKQDFGGITIRNAELGKAILQEASFRNARLQNVSFTPPFALTNKYYKLIKTINFDGASMDKLTFNALKGLGANVSGAVVI